MQYSAFQYSYQWNKIQTDHTGMPIYIYLSVYLQYLYINLYGCIYIHEQCFVKCCDHPTICLVRGCQPLLVPDPPFENPLCVTVCLCGILRSLWFCVEGFCWEEEEAALMVAAADAPVLSQHQKTTPES